MCYSYAPVSDTIQRIGTTKPPAADANQQSPVKLIGKTHSYGQENKRTFLFSLAIELTTWPRLFIDFLLKSTAIKNCGPQKALEHHWVRTDGRSLLLSRHLSAKQLTFCVKFSDSGVRKRVCRDHLFEISLTFCRFVFHAFCFFFFLCFICFSKAGRQSQLLSSRIGKE